MTENEINKYGLFVEKQKALPLIYEEVKLETGYRIDLLVEKKLIIEYKVFAFFAKKFLRLCG
jgi:GxxExxY protein